MNDSAKLFLLAALGGVAAWLWLSRSGQATAKAAGESVGSTIFKAVETVKNLTRGERNNNPGNIRITTSAWQGKIPAVENTDGAFEQFSSMVYGVRALAKTLLNYSKLYGLNTIEGIISRWAPGHENPTANYVKYIAAQLGVSPTDEINVNSPSVLERLTKAIIAFENGRVISSDEEIKEGVSRAFA